MAEESSATDTDSVLLKELEKYDYIQYVIPDVNTIPRGKVVRGRFKEKVARNGFETGNAICLPGPNFDLSMSIFDVLGHNYPNEEMRPCMETLTPWPWVSRQGRRVGNVLCDLVTADGRDNLTSPRQLLRTQLDRLQQRHGLELRTAFEYEFGVYHAESGEALGGSEVFCWDVKHWARHQDLFCQLDDALEEMGVEVSAVMPEMAPGQWELTTEPCPGLRGGDVALYVKSAVKGLFEARGGDYRATFMTKPYATDMAAGLHLNHSLWKVAGHGAEQREEGRRRDAGVINASGVNVEGEKEKRGAGSGKEEERTETDEDKKKKDAARRGGGGGASEERGKNNNDASIEQEKRAPPAGKSYPKEDERVNTLLDARAEDRLSVTARHWLAGVLHHAPALTALCCPTLNCYRRLFQMGTPGKATWGLDDRNQLLRVRTSRDNVFVESRLPSAACNPYLAMAGTVAAGLDGLDRRLTCPPAGGGPSPASGGAGPDKPACGGDAAEVDPPRVELPRTLGQALDALEKDVELRALLGEQFVTCYVSAKRDYEVKSYEGAGLASEEQQFQWERKMYMKNI